MCSCSPPRRSNNLIHLRFDYQVVFNWRRGLPDRKGLPSLISFEFYEGLQIDTIYTFELNDKFKLNRCNNLVTFRWQECLRFKKAWLNHKIQSFVSKIWIQLLLYALEVYPKTKIESANTLEKAPQESEIFRMKMLNFIR